MLADRYAELRESSRVGERPLLLEERQPNELELQARWFAGDFGKQFRSTAGDEIEIVQFGVWNREAGPDFNDAAVRVNRGEALRGSIEFDLADRSWETHGHATNEAFDAAVLHVFVEAGARTFFTRTRSNRNVPQVRVDPAGLGDSAVANLPLARPGRCQAPLDGLPEERVRSVLRAAAQFRLQRKAMRLRRILESHQRDTAIFQEIATALGYKENKLAFTLLAQRIPLALLRSSAGDAEALLFGTAGFLDAADLGVYAGDTRAYVRALWDTWWLRREPLRRLILPRKLWKFSGARPLNHPQRRVAALAALALKWPQFLKALSSREHRTIGEFFASLHHFYWDFHYSLRSEAATKPMALIGESRVTDILANVVFPLHVAEGYDIWPAYESLAAPLSNRRVETAATRLFGDDPRRKEFTKTVAFQQAFLQIYQDFCLRDNSDCAQCPFPEQMQKWK